MTRTYTLPAAPRRVLVAGDVHGDWPHLKFLIRTACARDCDALVQLGDLGYWPRFERGQAFLKKTRRALGKAGLDLYFVEGNHEDYEELLDERHARHGPFRLIVPPWRDLSRGGIWHIPRGARFDWQGVRFLGLGGGYSIDKAARTLGRDWFPQETITMGEVYAILDQPGTVDVLLAHDCPDGLLFLHGLTHVPESSANTRAIAAVCAHVKPKLILHGHYHHHHDTLHRDPGRDIHARVIGLDANNQLDPSQSFLVLDLSDGLTIE